MSNFLFGIETFEIIGLCQEVHRILGHGFKEIVYKDAITKEAEWRNIAFEREKCFVIRYKNDVLPHSFVADFIFFDEIIVEIKAAKGALNDDAICQTLNYLRASDKKVALILNFGNKSLEVRRLIF